MNEYMYITTTTSNNDKLDSSLFRLPSPPPNNNSTTTNFTSPFQQQLFSSSDDPTSCILADTWTSSSSSTVQPQPPSSTTTTTTADPTNNDPTACDLRDILMYYRSQPDLLRLILLSKVEEDKRRTEEARLRAKELDIMLLQQQQELMIGMLPGTMAAAEDQQLEESPRKRAREPSDTLFPISPTDEQQHPTMDNSNDESPSFPSTTLDTNTVVPSSSSSSSTTPTSLFHLASSYVPSQPNNLNNDSVSEQDSTTTGSVRRPPRRRREMQAITKIVETREYPYMDGFFWKNNGNTVQKKTGNKSIYYKCSNSSKGCPVNKTVTWKENGEYLIKYRGEHLPECGKVERIIDV
ncbi:hypothetical protein RO3G_03909 [Lichtheimia corymbifera JMRC:FSU:9682]|uniref:WRKY domain-containing protein n=1 Tax=Lichtheimia corymbifera JMRC:FSU:9682 TaxID=1263082 RepID=A0A068S905_9FUNG|nr:hypothetical protein RO3G_03909 [Lichtheimia corymbifera JMRC:FSU:9682]